MDETGGLLILGILGTLALITLKLGGGEPSLPPPRRYYRYLPPPPVKVVPAAIRYVESQPPLPPEGEEPLDRFRKKDI